MPRTVKLPFSREEMLAKEKQEFLIRLNKLFEDQPYDWTEVLKVMTEAMRSHPDWRRVEGTPLENDLPVRAAEAFFRMTGDG